MNKILIFTIFYVLLVGCGLQPSRDPIYVESVGTSVPTPSSLDMAISYINSLDPAYQVIGMWAIIEYPEELKKTLPLVIRNLSSENVEVRINAVRVLGELGPSAINASPELILIMKNDLSGGVKVEAAIALGTIGEKSAVPYLADNLFGDNEELAVFSAKSISLITGHLFPDSQSSGYRVDSNGNPYILMAAREWWLSEGQFEDWSKK